MSNIIPFPGNHGRERARPQQVPPANTEPPFDDPPSGQAAIALADTAARAGGAVYGKVEAAVAQGTLALAFPATSERSSASATPRLRLVQGTHGEPSVAVEGSASRDRPPAVPRDEPRAIAAQLARAVGEIAVGRRPAGALRQVTSSEVFANIAYFARVAGRQVTSGRADARSRSARPAVRPAVRSVRVCEAGDGVVEACVLLDDGRRVRPIALRLEARNQRWLCTALEMDW